VSRTQHFTYELNKTKTTTPFFLLSQRLYYPGTQQFIHLAEDLVSLLKENNAH
jgi:hypothetical protein